MDAIALARAQFGLNIAFHILFPALSIGLAWAITFLLTASHHSKNPQLPQLAALLTKIFAVTFALGAASGIVMSFQFGTNWPGFMEKIGTVAGPLLSFEILSAFFLEATFLGILLFGKNRVPKWVHTLSAWIVALGTTLSAFWILSLNSWMHTPDGYAIVDGAVVVTDWMAVVFNPSFPYRLAHMLTACLLTALFFMLGTFAYKALKTGDESWSKLLKKAAPIALVVSIAQAVIGDLHGLNTLEHQPAKVAAMEGIWEDKKGAPLLLFALPDQENESNRFEVGIPNLASLILTHDLNGEIKGLKSFEDRPDKVAMIFWCFRVMVGIGVLMILMSLTLSIRKPSSYSKFELSVTRTMAYSGWIAVLAGWMVTELGRQPWLVQGILKTKDSVGNVSLEYIQVSFVSYLVVYSLCLTVYLWAVKRMVHKFKWEPSSNG